MSTKTTTVNINTDELFTETNRIKLEKALNLSDIKILHITISVPVHYLKQDKIPVTDGSVMSVTIGTTVDLSALGEVIADQTDEHTTIEDMIDKGVELLYDKQCSMLQQFFVIH